MMQPPSKTKVWANEEVLPDTHTVLPASPTENIVAPEGDSDNEYQLLTKKPKTNHQEAPVEAALHPTLLQPDTEKDGDLEGEQTVPEDQTDILEDEAPPVSDADWLRSRTNRTLDLIADDDEDPPQEPSDNYKEDEAVPQAGDTQIEAPKPADKVEEAASSEEDRIHQTGRLFIRNLHYDVTDADIRGHFDRYGSLEEV